MTILPTINTTRAPKPSAARLEKLYEQRRSLDSYRNAASSSWTDERIELLTQLWADGLSCSQIAAQLGEGTTRNAVIGKVGRLKLPKRAVSHPKANISKRLPGMVQRRKRPARSVVANTTGRLPPLSAAEEAAFAYVEPAPQTGAPEPLGLRLIDLTDKTCRWPVGDPRQPGFQFCGHPPVSGSHYCPFHRQRSVGVGTSSEVAAVGAALKARRVEAA